MCSLIWHTAKDGNGGYVGMSVPACHNCRGVAMVNPEYDRAHLCADDVTPQEQERLVRLMEEAGEVIQACAKTLRWGWASVNPTLPVDEQEANGDYLRRELYDLIALAERLNLVTGPVQGAGETARERCNRVHQGIARQVPCAGCVAIPPSPTTSAE